MAKAGRIYHWKHGWIPLDMTAVASQRRKRTVAEKTNAHSAEVVNAVKKPRTRKPPNWVPPAENKPTWKPLSDAQKKALTKKTLTDSDAAAVARAAARIKALKNAGPPTKVQYVNGVYRITDDKGTVLSRTSDRHSANAWLARNGVDFDKANDLTANARADASEAEMRRDSYRKIETVDGVDFVTYKDSTKDPLGSDHGHPYQLTHDQMVPLADAYNEVKAEFPGMQSIQIVGVDGKTGAFGITSWDGRRISISSDLFDQAKIDFAAKQWGDHGAVAGQFVDDPEGFARAVMTHELGHALQMQNAEAMRKGQQLALERVHPGDVGMDVSSWTDEMKAQTAMRWEIDTLGKQSVYATGNKFEWFAEAFADGWFNGDKATPQGKLALGILRDAYGKAAA